MRSVYADSDGGTASTEFATPFSPERKRPMSMNYRMLKWLACGVVFAAVVCASGCSLLPSAGSDQPASPPPIAQTALPQSQPEPAHVAAAPQPAVPSAINIFGEFDGIERRPAPAGIEFGFQQHTTCDEGYDADAAIDPTGKWLAFTSTRHNERPDIYLQRVDGTSVIQLTSDTAPDVQPAFSPDGKRIAFCSTRSGNWDIYLMDIDGKNAEQITNTPAQEMHPSFSPDGNRLVYCALSPRSDQWEMWVVDLTSREKRIIGQGLFPAWSPRKDVERIAFQRARQRGSRWFSIWTVDLVNGEPTHVTEVAVSSNAAVISPAWSPDGSRLVFTTILQPNRPDAAQSNGPQDVWLASADGSGRQRLTDGDSTNLSPVWAVDNRIYFVSDRSGHENIWSVHVEAAKTATAAANPAPPAPKNGAAAESRPPAAKPNAAVSSTEQKELSH